MNYIVYRKLPSGVWKYVLRHSSEVEANKDVRMFQRRGIEAKVTVNNMFTIIKTGIRLTDDC